MEHYLDNSATTRVLNEAALAALGAMQSNYGNPSSMHNLGKSAQNLLEISRQSVGEAMGCKAENIIFTSGGSEAINTAILSAVYKNRRVGKHIVSTKIEHKATLNTLKALQEQGFEITLVAPQKDGNVLASDVLDAIKPNTALVSIMAVNSETGAILPTAEIATEMRKMAKETLIHVDAVQAFMKTEFKADLYDFASVSGHKIGACKGVGALFCRDLKWLKPLIFGGGQENGYRSGTEGMPQIASFGAACDVRMQNHEKDMEQLENLMLRLEKGLNNMPCAVQVNSPKIRAPHIINISPAVGKSEVIVRVLSDSGVYVSGGSACTKGKKSYVLAAMGVESDAINSAIRVSFCPENTKEDVDAFLEAFNNAIKMFL